MRLWHQNLISKLPRQQLLGQHRECAALRGLGFGKPHATVNYVFKYPIEKLVAYHNLIMDEMERRGYTPGCEWREPMYRGKKLGIDNTIKTSIWFTRDQLLYPEHNDEYLQECLDNLKSKGIDITM